MIKDEILQYLEFVSEIYLDLAGPQLEIAVCGGTALNLAGLLARPTKDVDVLFPETWPKELDEAVAITAKKFSLKSDWMNLGPVDLFRMGLPVKYFERCQKIQFHKNLVYLITSRYDQIHFKLYASVDRGGYHLSDLKSLSPNAEELLQAALWTMTHDVSAGFKQVLIQLLKSEGWADVASQLEK